VSWPTTVLRYAWYILTWEYLGQTLAIWFQEAETWVDIVRGCCWFWLIDGYCRRAEWGISSIFHGSPKWRKKRKHVQHWLFDVGLSVLNWIDDMVTWTIGNEPTHKERLTWTNPTFACQRRVRQGRSSGQGYSKRRLRTSRWFTRVSVICLLARSGSATPTRFDSDSVVIHVDNCASRCITNALSDFVGDPQQVVGRVKGMGGDKVAVQAVGTIKWNVEDDDGISHSFMIPGSLYIPDSPARLFSLQHWAQARKDNTPNINI
jgi:hypothetical protein